MIDLGNEFDNWWQINKFALMQDEQIGIREVALAAWIAGKASAKPAHSAEEREPAAATLSGLYNCYVCGEEKCSEDQKLYLCKDCGTGIVNEVIELIQDHPTDTEADSNSSSLSPNLCWNCKKDTEDFSDYGCIYCDYRVPGFVGHHNDD